MKDFQNKTVLITGASRGIGKAIALKLAADGAQIIIAAKSITENPKLGGTIYSAAREIEKAGGQALPVPCDIRFTDQIQNVIAQGIEQFGKIDLLINNASAIDLHSTEKMEEKHYDLMQDINVKGTFFVSQACIPFLKTAENPHILNLSPPLNFKGPWLSQHLAYTMSKFGMTLVAMGLAGELKKYGIAVNTLWPKTTIATAAVRNLLGGEALIQKSRQPQILADAAYAILRRPASECTGNHFIDEEVLLQEGITNFDLYAMVKNGPLQPDLFL